MDKAIIKILDSVHCRANKYARQLILPALKYESTEFKRSRWKDKKFKRGSHNIITRYLITGRTGTKGLFYTGLLPRVKKYCRKNKIKISILGKEEQIEINQTPKLPGITFRNDQKNVFKKIMYKQRGKIIFPTGTGKTIIAMGIISMFNNCRILFLCHTIDLLNQTHEQMKKYFNNIYLYGGKNKQSINWKNFEKIKQSILVSTIQSFSKFNPELYSAFFDIVIIDEEHHVNSQKSQYGKVLSLLLAPRRYGLTATEPTKQKELLINEGLLGPVISRLTIKEGMNLGIIAKPQIKLIPIPYESKLNIKCENKYKNFYKYAIIKNKARNSLIAKEVKKCYNNNKIILILIDNIMHGRRIAKAIYKVVKIKPPFVYGDTPKNERNKVKKDLQTGKLKIAICSKIWKEGINIPSLNVIINADGKKEEKGVLQAIGRGLRTTKNKNTIKLIDFLDPYRYLAEHSILRIQIYIRKGWL